MPNNGTQQQVANIVAALLERLDRVNDTLMQIRDAKEQEPSFDVTYVFVGNPAAASVVSFQLPKTLKHVELELSVGGSIQVALLMGQIQLADAQNRHQIAAAPPVASNAEITSAGGRNKARAYLDGSGFLTVFFTAAGAASVNVRVIGLDKTQQMPQRT